MDMSQVHPDLRDALEARPAFDLAAEVLLARRDPPPPSAPADAPVRVEDLVVPGPAGAPPVGVRLYAPAASGPSPRPGLLWIHGGGYVLGSAYAEDTLGPYLSLTADCVVVSVDYRLAPEHPFPAGLEDCYAALRWLADAAPGVDRDRLGVAGMSAGGGLAAALALLARDRGGPALAFQMPICPMIDDRGLTPSSRFDDPRVWNGEANRAAWAMYLGDLGGGEVSAYAAPARAQDLGGLPPAYISVGALDPFRDEDVEYARRLAEAGVPTELHLFPGCFHGFEGVPSAPVAARARAEYAEVLRRGLWDPRD